MNKFTQKFIFADGHFVTLRYESQNNLTPAYLAIKFAGLERKFEEENPFLFSAEYQEECTRIWNLKKKANSDRTSDLLDALISAEDNRFITDNPARVIDAASQLISLNMKLMAGTKK